MDGSSVERYHESCLAQNLTQRRGFIGFYNPPRNLGLLPCSGETRPHSLESTKDPGTRKFGCEHSLLQIRFWQPTSQSLATPPACIPRPKALLVDPRSTGIVQSWVQPYGVPLGYGIGTN